MGTGTEFWLTVLAGFLFYTVLAIGVVALFWACGLSCICAKRGADILLDDADTDAEPLIEKSFDVAP